MNPINHYFRSRLAALLVTFALPVGFAALAQEPAADSLQFKRVLLSPEQLPGELERVKQGVLVRLTQAQFDKLLSDACKRTAEGKTPPRLVEARYRATLQAEPALVGTGQWKTINPVNGPALLPLQPLNLALRQARFENAGDARPDALLADFDGRNPALLLEQTGERSLALDWSARADVRPEGLYFTLEFPPAPVTVLELNLPADHVVNVGAGVVLSGPHPAEMDNRRLWKLTCSGKPGVNLWIRRAADMAAAPPLVFVHQQTTQKLTPEGQEAWFQFDLEAPRPGVQVLEFDCDPDLRPCEATGANGEALPLAPASLPTGEKDKAEGRWLIRLPEPLLVGSNTVTIRCLAPLGTPGKGSRFVAWTSPGMRLVRVASRENAPELTGRAVLRGETLEVQAHPDVRLDTWQAGAFRLLDTTTKADSDGATPFQCLTLSGGSVEPDGPGRRPSARLLAGGVEFRARQAAWWRLAPEQSSLMLQIIYEVHHGQLFQLPVQLPPGWDVDRVETTPPNVRTWGVKADTPDKGKTTLFVDLQHPLVLDDVKRDRPASAPFRPRGSILTVWLHPSRPASIVNRELPFPDAIPLGARFREGALGIDFDEQTYQPTIKPLLPESELDEEGPWGKQPLELYYAYRGQPVAGTLLLRPRAPQVRAKCSSEVFLGSGRAAVETRLLLEAETGSIDTLEVVVSAEGGEPWTWQVEQGDNQIRRVERLTAPLARDLASVTTLGQPLAAATLVGARPHGERWRITLARPLRPRAPLVLRADRQLDATASRWDVPLLVVLRASRMEGEATLHLAGGDRVQLESLGLREAPAASSARGRAGPWRTFRYGELPVGLTLLDHRRGNEQAAAVIEEARLTTFVAVDGSLQVYFSFQAAHWSQRALPVILPAGAQARAALVDGHWLPQLALAATNGGSVLELPVPARGELPASESAHQFEIVYTLPAPGTFVWPRAVSPAPSLPVPPLQFRQTWCLPPGLRPLETNYRRLPDPAAASEPDGWRANWTAQLPDPLTRPLQDQGDDGTAQMQALIDACQAVRKGNAGRKLPLREVLELVRNQANKELRGIVIDALALEEAGIGPETWVTLQPLASNQDQTPPWEALGLTAFPARAAPLLTVRHQGEVWPPEGNTRLGLPEAVENCVTEAAANGHDSTGRFALALEWCRGSTDARATRSVAGTRFPAPVLASWTEWEALPGTDPAAGVRLVRRDTITAVGLLLAVLLGVVFWRLGWRSPGVRLTFLLLWLGLAGIALAWLPPALRALALWPLPPACVLTLVWYVAVLGRVTPRKAPATVIAVAATAAAVVVALFDRPETGQALPPDVPTVYILPGPADQPEKRTVLVATEFLDHLHALARPAPLAPTGAVLTSASYDGTVVEGAAEFNAVYQAFCLGKEPATLTIPLDGVRLVDDVWLDGARVFPTTLPSPQTGFTLKMSGAGAHKIELRFRAAITGADEDRDLQFTAPRLLQSRLRLELPPSASFVQAVSRYGSQTLATTSAAKTLEVDLGRLTGPVHLHWFEEVLPPLPVKVRYKEAYCWDLRPDGANLQGLVLFDVYQGHAQTLDVRLPPELEVRGVEPRRPDGGGAIRLQNWRVRSGAGGESTLRLRFANPVSGPVLVGLDLVPVAALSSQTPLALPVPQGSPINEGGYVAYRMRGLDVRPNPQKLRQIKNEDFAPFWPAASRPNIAALARCYAFNRDGGAKPLLRVQVLPQQAPVQAVQEMRVRVDARLARVRATVELTSPQNDLSVVEWDLLSPQPVTIASVTGAGVRTWSQAGTRLLVWLEKTSGTAKVEIFGWLPLALNDGPHLELPCFRLRGVQNQQTTVRVVAAAGLAVSAARLGNLQPLAGQQAGDPDLVYTSKQDRYEGTFAVQSAAASADVQIFTFVEAVNRQVRFTTTIDYHIKGGELRTVQIRLRDWKGKDVKLEAAQVLQQHERRRSLDNELTWTLELRPSFREPFHLTWGLLAGPSARLWRYEGVTKSYRVTLRGELPIEEAVGGVPAPQVSVVDAAVVERWLAVAGPELGIEGVSRMKPEKDFPRVLKAWPGELARLQRVGGRVWKATDVEATLRLVPQDRGPETSPIQVFLREQVVAVADNQHWLHEAVYWLRHDAHTDLNLTLPAAARVVGVSLDGVDTPPLQPEPTRLWLPLPARAGVRCVRLRWVYEPPEPLDHPNLDLPKLEGAEEGPWLWTIHVPPGFDVQGSGSGLKAGLGRAAWLDLKRADAHLQMIRRLVEQTPSGVAPSSALLAAQRRFVDLCRRTERTLEACGDAPGETGPGGITLREWLEQLRGQNHDLAMRFGLEEAADSPAETEIRVGVLPRRGVSLYGVTDTDMTVLPLRLTPDTVRRERAALLTSAAWLGGVGLIAALSFFPALLPWGRRLAPEQVALAGGGAWLLGWPMAVVLFLLLAAVLGRVLIAVSWLRRLLPQAVPVPATVKKSSVRSSV